MFCRLTEGPVPLKKYDCFHFAVAILDKLTAAFSYHIQYFREEVFWKLSLLLDYWGKQEGFRNLSTITLAVTHTCCLYAEQLLWAGDGADREIHLAEK